MELKGGGGGGGGKRSIKFNSFSQLTYTHTDEVPPVRPQDGLMEDKFVEMGRRQIGRQGHRRWSSEDGR